MAKFCGKCGAKLDEQTGRCPNCDIEVKNAAPVNDVRTSEKEPKKKGPFLKIILIALLVLVLGAGAIGALAYFKIVDIPIVNDILGFEEEENEEVKQDEEETVEEDTSSDKDESEDIDVDLDADDKDMEEEYKVTPPDADEYFEENAEIVSEVGVRDSSEVLSETEVSTLLAERGFTQYPVVTEYNMDGEYQDAIEISSASSEKHPTYQTYYVTENGEIWTIFVIENVIMANPVSYNLESGLEVQVMISETETVTSYDGTKNKFYETIPNESALIVKKIDRIDAETLEKLTSGEIGNL